MSRVPGAEPLSTVEALREIHKIADTASVWYYGDAYDPTGGRTKIRSLAREALEALRAERTSAPASGALKFPAIDLLRDWLIQFLGRSASVPADHIQPREPCYFVPDQARLLLMELGRALASALTPQPDVEQAVKETAQALETLLLGSSFDPDDACLWQSNDPEAETVETILRRALARVPPAPQPKD